MSTTKCDLLFRYGIKKPEVEGTYENDSVSRHPVTIVNGLLCVVQGQFETFPNFTRLKIHFSKLVGINNPRNVHTF